MDDTTQPSSGAVDLVLVPGLAIHVEDGLLADRLRSEWALVPGTGRRLCRIRVDDALRPDGTVGAVRLDGDLVVGGALACAAGVATSAVLPWVNALLISDGVLPLHASAFSYGDLTFAMVGHAHSGKTGALLAAHEAGATALGDECIWLSDGMVYSVRLPVEIRARYLGELPRHARVVPRGSRWRACLFDRAGRLLPSGSEVWQRRFDGRARVVTSPERLFGEYGAPRRLDRLVISTVGSGSRTEVVPVDPIEARDELLQVQRHELRRLFDQLATQCGTGAAERLDSGLRTAIDRVVERVVVRRLLHPARTRAHDLARALLADDPTGAQP